MIVTDRIVFCICIFFIVFCVFALTAFPLSSSRVNSFVFKKRSVILFVLGKCTAVQLIE